jgi:hypothetical protein
VAAASRDPSFQALADRTKFLYNATVRFVSNAVKNVVIAALSGNTIGLQATGFGSGAGLKGIGGATGNGVEATTTAGYAFSGVAGASGLGAGLFDASASSVAQAIRVVGASGVGGYCAVFQGSGSGHGIVCNAGSGGIAGEFNGSGEPAVKAVNTTGFAVHIEGDTTSPVRAALRFVPQDTQPTGAHNIGDMYVTAAGVLKICTAAGTPGTWTSVGAQV